MLSSLSTKSSDLEVNISSSRESTVLEKLIPQSWHFLMISNKLAP
jgi:hypothetical protein